MLRKWPRFFSLTFLVASTLVLSGCGKEEEPIAYRVDLEIWGVFDDTDAYRQIIAEYQKINPFVGSINYRKLDPETYKEELIDAMAAGNGPDIFMMRNTWVDSFRDKTVPAPETLITEKNFRESFVDVAAEDSIRDGAIYSVPLSVDSLALYYNKDLFNAASITTPPTTWGEVESLVPRLTSIDRFGNVTRSAIALGTAYNINRSTDLLLALGYQLGANPDNFGDRSGSSAQALSYYTQFARSGSANYTWNPRLHYSIDAFYEGSLAMMVNYSWHYQTIKQKNAKFNFAVAPLPQFAGQKPVNFANYWSYAVTKNKLEPKSASGQASTVPAGSYQDARTREAWQFLTFLAFAHPNNAFTVRNVLSGAAKDFPVTIDPAKVYLERTKKPAARRDLIETQKGDLQLAPFATGNLITRSWRPGNPEAVETIIAEGIDSVNRGERTVNDALSVMANRLKQFQIR